MDRQLQRFDIRDGFEKILAGIEQDGGVIVENFISEDLRRRLVAELKDHADGYEPGMDGGVVKQMFCGARTKRFTGLATKAPSFAEVMDHDLMHEWAENSFRNDYWLNTAQAIIIGPEEPAQMLHRDAGIWPVILEQGKDGPEGMLCIMLALSEFTEENGATCVVPGSHRWDDFAKQADPEDVARAVMPPGSALMFTGKTLHGGGANVSVDSWRFGVQMSFALGQLTPEEAHTVATPWEVAKDFPERVQHMLGYASHRSFLADWPVLWTYDYRDVRDFLEPASAGTYASAGTRQLAIAGGREAEDEGP